MSQEADIAVLKEKAEQQEKEMRDMRTQHEKMFAKVDELHELLTRYKGFIGGAIFLWSCIWTAVLTGVGLWFKFFRH